MNFGVNVQQKREELKMTQEQLAQKTGMSRQMISHIEVGRKIANIYMAKDIAHALDCSLDELTAENCA